MFVKAQMRVPYLNLSVDENAQTDKQMFVKARLKLANIRI